MIWAELLCSALAQPMASQNILNTNSSKMGHEYGFTTQTVLCEAPYYLVNTSMYNKKEVYLLKIILLQWSEKLVEVLRVSHVHTTSTTQFKLCHPQKLTAQVRPTVVHVGRYTNE